MGRNEVCYLYYTGISFLRLLPPPLCITAVGPYGKEKRHWTHQPGGFPALTPTFFRQDNKKSTTIQHYT